MSIRDVLVGMDIEMCQQGSSFGDDRWMLNEIMTLCNRRCYWIGYLCDRLELRSQCNPIPSDFYSDNGAFLQIYTSTFLLVQQNIHPLFG